MTGPTLRVYGNSTVCDAVGIDIHPQIVDRSKQSTGSPARHATCTGKLAPHGDTGLPCPRSGTRDKGELSMRDGWRIADSDMHVMEPADLWQRYIDPA